MKIHIVDPPEGAEDSVTISVKQITENILRAIDLLKSPEGLSVFAKDRTFIIQLSDIFRIESVDLKTFVYGKTEVYRSRLKLYEIEALLSDYNFLRVSKQEIINLKKTLSISPAGGGRFTAHLSNGEHIVISRQYVPALKERFGI